MPARRPALLSPVGFTTPPLLGEMVEEFLAEYEFGDSPATTLKTYRSVLSGRLVKHFGELVDVAELDPAALRGWMRTVNEEVSPGSLRTYYAITARFFAWLVEQEHIERSPFDRVRKPGFTEPQRVGFTEKEVGRLLHYAAAGPGFVPTRDYAICVTLLGTALRAAELLSMTTKPAALDRANRMITVVRKGGREKKSRMGAKVAAAIREYMKVRPAKSPTDALWLSQRNTPLQYLALSGMLKRLGERAAVAEVTAHRFRHTAAVAHYTRHRDLIALKNFLGHSDVKVTMTYLRQLGVEYGLDETYTTPDEWLA